MARTRRTTDRPSLPPTGLPVTLPGGEAERAGRKPSEEFFWWLVGRQGVNEEAVRNDPVIQRAVQEEADRRTPEVIRRVMEALDQPRPALPDDFSHSEDFRIVRWRGETFRFSKTQAVVIEALYRDWCGGGGGLSADSLFTTARSSQSEQKVRKLFKATRQKVTTPHPALDRFLLHLGGNVWKLCL